jgi:hypothetical protein
MGSLNAPPRPCTYVDKVLINTLHGIGPLAFRYITETNAETSYYI